MTREEMMGPILVFIFGACWTVVFLVTVASVIAPTFMSKAKLPMWAMGLVIWVGGATTVLWFYAAVLKRYFGIT